MQIKLPTSFNFMQEQAQQGRVGNEADPLSKKPTDSIVFCQKSLTFYQQDLMAAGRFPATAE